MICIRCEKPMSMQGVRGTLKSYLCTDCNIWEKVDSAVAPESKSEAPDKGEPEVEFTPEPAPVANESKPVLPVSQETIGAPKTAPLVEEEYLGGDDNPYKYEKPLE